MGAGCDGVVPSDGNTPNIIDACGVCGGDESECAIGRAARTAHAVGDPHYLTYDGISFDYQVAGEFILSRHMNDIELQNEQMVCPNPRVRCNIGAAVITRNWNIQFRSEWKLEKIMVNGVMWTVNNQYKFGHLAVLDVFTSIRIYSTTFSVYYNDIQGATGATAYGNLNRWGPPLPNNYYMNLYMEAPGRWSSGLSMTGLFANFDYDRSDDWESISPSTMWWVKGTKNSAFTNPEYRLDWGNRIVKAAKAVNGPGPSTRNKQIGQNVQLAQMHENFEHTNWTIADERRALVQVDTYTAKMRKRLFAKMAHEGAILRKAGQKKPATGLGGAELNIMQYPGERPDHLRVEQQMLFRKEWKVLTAPQRSSMLDGQVTSNNAVSPDMMCMECTDGSPRCAAQGITKTPTAGITWMAVTAYDPAGIASIWAPADRKAECHAKCLPSRPVSPVICKCWLDCSLGVDSNTCRFNAHWNVVTSRMIPLVPAVGEGNCINVNVHGAAVYRAVKYRPELWDEEDASNFAISMWYKPRPTTSCEKKTIHSLLYKGPMEVDYSAEPVAIEVDATNCDSAAHPKLPIIATVAGQEYSSGPNNGIAKEGWSFIAVMKKNDIVTLWLGSPDAGDTAPIEIGTMTLAPTARYVAKESDAIFLVSPTADLDRIPYGYVGKMNYIPASLWDNEVPLIYGDKEPKECGA